MTRAQPIVMPKLGLTMTEGVLAEWKIAPGDAVKAGDVIFVVETDKISNEIEATADGVIEALAVGEGDLVPVGGLVATLRADGAGDAEAGDRPAPDRPATPVRTVATPLARRLAVEAGLDPASLRGSGPRGRIMADDVTAALESREPGVPAAAAPAPLAPPPGALRPAGTFQSVAARRLTEAKRDIPHFYVMAEADVTELLDLRERLNIDQTRARLTINHFIIAGAARALATMPEANVVWTNEGVLQLATIDVGIAVESPKGLVAPVLRDLGVAALDDIAARANGAVERARAGKLSAADMQGGAISISNVGMFGATALIPIVNPGQSSILGVGRNQALFRPDRDGRPVVREIVTLALSCDHRVIDGALAARFLRRLAQELESPLSLLRGAIQGTVL